MSAYIMVVSCLQLHRKQKEEREERREGNKDRKEGGGKHEPLFLQLCLHHLE